MAISSLQAAHAICENRKWTVSHIEIQKILYIAHATYMADFDSSEHKLINENFQAWKFGPVAPKLYDRLQKFRKKDVSFVFYPWEWDNGNDTGEYRHTVKISEDLRDASASMLITATHASGGAWEKYYDPNVMSKNIPNIDIFEEYARYKKNSEIKSH